ncbi:MAG: ROK family protein [Candidatus Nanopelagicales bacterium]
MASERTHSLSAVLGAVRRHPGVTQSLLISDVGLGRSVVTARLAELQGLGLVVEDGLAPSTGGRAPRLLRLRAEAGVVGGIAIGALGMEVGIADLYGRTISRIDDPISVADGPEVVLGKAEALLERQLASYADGRPVWGIGVGVPGPVEFGRGVPVAPPIMPGWDGYPVRDRIARRYDAPVWVDNDVNLLALGELRTSHGARGVQDMIYVKIGTGIGAGLVSRGRIHRGANGSAGDIGHVSVSGAENVVCRCGNTGCLEAMAGGAALVRDGRRLAESGASSILAGLLAANGTLVADDVVAAAERGDPEARALLANAGQLVGTTLASLVSFYNPALVVLGGGVVRSGDQVLAAIREAVYRRSLPLATRTLRIEPTALRDGGGMTGAVHLALDQLFWHDCLAEWVQHGSPAGHPELSDVPTEDRAA